MNRLRWSIVVCVLAVCCALPAGAVAGLLEDGERALAEDDLVAAEAAFVAYAKDDANPPELRARAFRGLALARHHLWLDDSSIIPLCRAVIADPQNLSVLGTTEFIRDGIETYGCSEEYYTLVPEVVAAAAPYPVAARYTVKLQARAAACRGDRDAVNEIWSTYHNPPEVLVLGPFPNVGASGLGVAYAPEYEIDLDATYYDRIGRPLRWQLCEPGARGLIDFDMLFDDEADAIGYALVYARFDEELAGSIHISGSGTSMLWLNDTLVHMDDEPTCPGRRNYDVPVTFVEGWNRVILKSGAERQNLAWFMSMRDRNGLPLDVETSVDPMVYEESLPAEVVLGGPDPSDLPRGVMVFAESHPLRRWVDMARELSIQDLAILVAYLREVGMADDAEAALKIGDERFPDSGILDLLRAEMLDYRERTGEATALRRQVAERSPVLLEATASLMAEMSSQGEFERAVAMLEEMELENSPGLYQRMFWASLLIRRGAVAEGMATMEELFQESPGNGAIRGTYLSMLQMAGRIRELEEGMAMALEARPDDYGLLRQYAAIAYERGDYDEAIETLERALEFCYRPDRLYLEISTVLEADGRPEEAVEALRKALEYSPVSVAAHHGLGSALLKIERSDEAIEHLQIAAERDPYSLTLRTTIRDAQGLPPLSDYFETEKIAELAAQDMSWIEGDAEAVRLLDAADIIVYPDGAHSIRHHMATKVLSASGVEDASSMDTPYFWSDEQGQVEIARTIKADGREIEAERGYGEIAFSDVEPGDVVEYRYTIRFAPEVGLKEHFWDDHYFQFYVPCLLSRLSILTPTDMEYEWVSHNSEIRPTVTEHDGGLKLAVWESERVQRDAVELSMPAAEERVAWVDVSTIESWDDIVDWYDSQSRGRVRAGEGVKTLAAELAEDAPDDSTRIHRVAHHVMTEIRYESGQFSGSANVPRAAEEVLRTGFGDCKDQSCLMIGLLRQMGIEARFALVNSRDVITVPYLPSPRFTHAIVRATAGDGRVFWIDPTAIGLTFPNIPVGLEGAQALLVDAEHPEFVVIETEPASTNGHVSSVRGVLESTGRMAVSGTAELHGEDASGFRMLMHAMPAYREQVAEAMVTDPHPGAVISSAELEASGDPDAPVKFTFEASLAAAGSRAGDLLILDPPWTMSGVPFDIVSTEKRAQPLVLDSWRGEYVETVEIELPEGCTPIEELTSVDIDCPHGAFTLTRSLDGNTLTLVNSLRIDSIRIEPEGYRGFREMLEAAWRAEQEPIVLRVAS